MLGSEAPEPGELSTDQKTQILPTPDVFGVFVGVTLFEYQKYFVTKN